VLLTGATGLVGRYLVRDLLVAGHRVAVLVRSTPQQSAPERVEAIVQLWERALGRLFPRPVCLEGDVTTPGLGLSDRQQRWVGTHCRSVIHNGAVLTFHGPDREGEPWRTNLRGTRNVLDLCRALSIVDLHHVSTAYVCGDRAGVIGEDELECGQGFRNDYEESKYLAELMVRSAGLGRPPTIYRPAVIAGDSRTGYTSTYHGLYLYLKLIAIAVTMTRPDADGVRRVRVRLNLRGDEPRNVVPVDWVSAVIVRLFENPEAHGRTYHLAPTHPITPLEIYRFAGSYFHVCGLEFVGDAMIPSSEQSEMERIARENLAIYSSYETTDPRFDTTNLIRMAGPLPCPRIDEAMLHRFIEYGEIDGWGRRPEPPLREPFWVEPYLERLAPADVPLDPGSAIGLDVEGPGGGSWQLLLDGSRLAGVQPGTPAADRPSLRLPSSLFARLVRGELSDPERSVGRHVTAGKGTQVGPLARSLVGALLPHSYPLS
jgi:thioester reductase-like protein